MNITTAACYPIRYFRHATAALALTGLMMLGPGCLNEKTSDRDVALIDSNEAQSLQAGARTILGGPKNAIVLDPRPLHEWRQGHLEGALHLPLESLRDRLDELDGADVVIVYGTGFRSPIAIATAKALHDAGIKDVRVLEGGYQGWERAGLAVSTE